MTPKEIITVGSTFYYFTVLKEVGRVNGKPVVLARCICGNVKQIQYLRLKYGEIKSCGCKKNYLIGQKNQIHGMGHKNKHPLYGIWNGMKRRCYDKNEISYKNYGGRGITVCDQWVNSFLSFYNWAINNGWLPNLQLDREDNDGNYNPDNCRFSTSTIQCRNRRTSRILECDGAKKTLAEWSEIYGVKSNRISRRIESGWSISDAIKIPAMPIICAQIKELTESDKKRFWDKVRKTKGCWIWTAKKSDNGYGVFSIDKVGRIASRVAYTITNGEIPNNLFVLHSCDNRACVNPSHLSVGTHQDNMDDMVRKKRVA